MVFFLSRSKAKKISKRQAEVIEPPKIVGYHVMETQKEPELEHGIPIFKAGSTVKLRIFGEGFSENSKIGLTAEKGDSNTKCHKMIDIFEVRNC